MLKQLKILLAVGLLLAANIVLARGGALSESAHKYAQFMVGGQPLDDAWVLTDEDGVSYVADIDSMRLVGFSLQAPLNKGRFEYGFEGAGYVGYDSDRKVFVRVSGQDSFVKIDSDLWTGDFSVGGFISIKPNSWMRFYAGAGPSILLGKISRDDESNVENNDGSVASGDIFIDTRNDNFDSNFAVYGRVGAEVIFPNGFILGVSARQVNADLDFGGNGKVDFNTPQYFLTLGQYF